jgi:ribose transport system permease protein
MMSNRSDTESIATVLNAERKGPSDSGGTNGVKTLVFLRDRGIIVLWVVLVAVFAFWAAPYFFTLANAALVANVAALTAIFAAAVAFGVLSGALDLSIPGTATLAAVTGGTVLHAGAPVWLGIAVTLAVGVGIGIINGVLVQRGLNPLVVTIATLTVTGGVAQVIAGGVPVSGITQLTWMGSTDYFGVPAPVFVVALVFLVGAVFLSQTRAGVRLMAVGGNIEAVRRAGINANWYRVLGFALSGVCAAIGGLLVMATTTQASPNPSVDLLFSALTAVALSGMPLTGGRGSLIRVLIGALIIATISSALVIKGIPPYFATIATGVLLVAALAFEKVMSSEVARRLAPPPTASLPIDPTTATSTPEEA